MRVSIMVTSVVALLLMALLVHAQYPGETLIFDDEFDTFDLSVWKHELTAAGGGNWEFEVYMNNRTNSYVNNSCLYIQPTYTAQTFGQDPNTNGATLDLWGMDPPSLCTSNFDYGCSRTTNGDQIINPIVSARIRTAEHFSFKYGRMEVRAKMPRGDWLWPAIWLLPVNQPYGNWPASGEIDVVESRGNGINYAPGGVNQIGSTLHFGPNYQYDAYPAAHESYMLPAGEDFSQDFHIFGLYWNETTMYTYVDTPTNVVLSVDMTSKSFWQVGSNLQGWGGMNFANPWEGQGNNAPFDSMFYIILNLAVGGVGGYFPDDPSKPWQNSSPIAPKQFWNAQGQWGPTWQGNSAMVVDYVRVWGFDQTEFKLGNLHVKNRKVVNPADKFKDFLL